MHIHILSVDELELDIDPRDVQAESAFGLIREFISFMGQLLRKPVLLAHEGIHDPPFMLYDPEARAFRLLDAWMW